jgi:UrcA family protein
MRYSIIPVACACVAAFAALNVSAAQSMTPFNGSISEPVHFGDLDLSKPAEVEVLLKRVRRAARNVCSPLTSRHFWPQRSKCIERAMANAIREVDNVALTARYLAAGDGQRKRTERWNSAGVRP